MLILCISGYLLAVSIVLLFIRCASYNIDPCVLLYESKLPKMYKLLFDKIGKTNKKVSGLAYSNSTLGSIYRVLISKEYLLNKKKYESLGFSEIENSFVQENIISGLEIRASIFKHIHYTICLLMIVLGSFVGLNV